MTGEISFCELAARLEEGSAYEVRVANERSTFADLAFNLPPDSSVLAPIRVNGFRVTKFEYEDGEYLLRIV